jgi:hypothetical protein
MKYKLIWSFVFISIVFSGCYSIEGIEYIHMHNDEINNYAYNGVWNNNLLPYYYDDKIFSVNLSSEVYINVPSDMQIRNKYNYFTVFINISSKEFLENFEINICKIQFDDYVFEFDGDDLENIIYKSYTKSVYNINYQIIISKKIIKNDYNKIKNILKNSVAQRYIIVKLDLNYSENGEIKNWANNTELSAVIYQDWYTPNNLWGWSGVDRIYK